MKAYLVTNSITREYSVVVFAESPGKAKALVQGTDGFEDDSFTELSAYRKPELDPFYKGHRFMDWDDPDDRVAMVRYGGYVCSDEAKEFEDCKECPAREWCSEAEDEESEAEREREAAALYAAYCEQYEPTYNPEDGSM